MQPLVTAEIDTGSASCEGRPTQRHCLVRLRRGDRSIITTIGLPRTCAEQLAEQIIDVLAGPETTLDVTELLPFRADIDYARGRLPFDGTYSIDDLQADTARLVKTLKAAQIDP